MHPVRDNPSLTAAQEFAIHQAACELVLAAVQKRTIQLSNTAFRSVEDVAVMGAFVTLKQNGKLRGCCGIQGHPMPLSRALTQSAARAATDDHRFPPVSYSELPHLTLDVTLLFNFETITVLGDDRIAAVEPGRHGLRIQHHNKAGLLLPSVAIEHGLDAATFLEHVCRKAGLPSTAWQEPDALLQRFEGRMIQGDFDRSLLSSIGTETVFPCRQNQVEALAGCVGNNESQPQTGGSVRPAGVAGRFYPGDAPGLSGLVDECIGQVPEVREQWPAVIVPHAGLIYSGRIAGGVLKRIRIPDTVIIIGPKHTPHGAEWAVAPHDVWQLPGITLKSDTQLARLLADHVDGLQLDAAAHAREHAIEVELPLLARLAPRVKVVGIVIGEGSLEQCCRFGRQLANVISELPSTPLLVISSDMNHFASDRRNRELDELALDAMESLDPATLLHTVRSHNISMCGVLPAVIVMETLRCMNRLTRTERTGYATSADVSGDKSRVVGYAGMLLG